MMRQTSFRLVRRTSVAISVQLGVPSRTSVQFHICGSGGTRQGRVRSRARRAVCLASDAGLREEEMLGTNSQMSVSAAVFVLALMCAPAFAGPGGGGGGGGMGGMSGANGNFGGQSGSHMSSEGMSNTDRPNSSDRDFGADRALERRHSGHTHTSSAHGMSALRSRHQNFGGRSVHHISAHGLSNTNGPNATTRSFGMARAQQRRP